MAWTKAAIIFNYRQAMRQATELDSVAANLERLSKRELENALDNVAANWQGDNANIYCRKGDRLQGNINSTARELRSAAAEIRRIAKRIYDAEMANLEIAMKRNY